MERLRASEILKEAARLDEKGEYGTAINLYRDGIELLIPIQKDIKVKQDEEVFLKKIEKYSERMKAIEEILKNAERENQITCVRIADGETGYSYASLFGEYLDKSVHRVEIEDPYIRASHQVMNLVKLCELLIHKTSVNFIRLTTTRDEVDKVKDQFVRLADLTSDLASRGIKLEVSYSLTLHDREIRFDNGWMIRIGRGLDYFKPMKSQFHIGFCDMDLRPCQATTVEIYNKNHFTS